MAGPCARARAPAPGSRPRRHRGAGTRGAPVHPQGTGPPDHRDRRAPGRGPRTRAGSVPLGPGRLPVFRRPSVTIVAHELKASYAFIERNFFLTRRYWGWELAFL